MIKLKSKERDFELVLPTSLDEITVTDLAELTANIEVPKYNCVVAMCFKVKLFDLAATINANKEQTVSVVNILAKNSKFPNDTIEMIPGNILIIDRSSLERSVHFHNKSVINSKSVQDYIASDKQLRQDIIEGRIGNNSKGSINKSLAGVNSPYIYIIEFKIVPLNYISGVINKDVSIQDPFKNIVTSIN